MEGNKSISTLYLLHSERDLVVSPDLERGYDMTLCVLLCLPSGLTDAVLCLVPSWQTGLSYLYIVQAIYKRSYGNPRA